MRNIFDQYSQPENRLTHALVSSIANDKYLLHEFIKWITGRTFSQKEKIYVIEQSLPDQLEESEEDARRKGLPDACIYTDDGWVLIIESKVASSISINQLDRHIGTLKRRGFTDIRLLVINTDKNISGLPDNTSIKLWSEIYEWGYQYVNKTIWAKHFTGYFEAAEAKMIKDEYLKDGTLTRFTGIHFGIDDPYTYPEAKRLLKLLMGELKTRKELIKEMGIDPLSPGRGAIKGTNKTAVWDYLSIHVENGPRDFTKNPHITIGITDTVTEVAITIPNSVKKDIFNNIFKKEFNSFSRAILETLQNMVPITRNEPGMKPYVRIDQGHTIIRGGDPIKDAKLEFDLRTAFNIGSNSGVKQQQQWINTAFEVMRNKKSNLQFQLGVYFQYDICKTVKSSRAIDLFVEAIVAMKPFLDMAMGR